MYNVEMNILGPVDEHSYNFELDSLDEVNKFILSMMKDAVHCGYNLSFELGRVEIKSAHTTIIYTWEKRNPKLDKLMNSPSPFA